MGGLGGIGHRLSSISDSLATHPRTHATRCCLFSPPKPACPLMPCRLPQRPANPRPLPPPPPSIYSLLLLPCARTATLYLLVPAAMAVRPPRCVCTAARVYVYRRPRDPGAVGSRHLQGFIPYIARFLRRMDPNHLLMVGLDGFFGPHSPHHLQHNPPSHPEAPAAGPNWGPSLGAGPAPGAADQPATAEGAGGAGKDKDGKQKQKQQPKARGGGGAVDPRALLAAWGGSGSALGRAPWDPVCEGTDFLRNQVGGGGPRLRCAGLGWAGGGGAWRGPMATALAAPHFAACMAVAGGLIRPVL